MIGTHKLKPIRLIVAVLMTTALVATSLPFSTKDIYASPAKGVDGSGGGGTTGGGYDENATGNDTGTNAGAHKGGASTNKSGYLITIVDRSTGQQLAGTQNYGVGANGKSLPTNYADYTDSRLGGHMDQPRSLDGIVLPPAFDASGNSNADQLKSYLNSDGGKMASNLISQLYGPEILAGVKAGKYALDMQTLIYFNDSKTGNTLLCTALGGAQAMLDSPSGVAYVKSYLTKVIANTLGYDKTANGIVAAMLEGKAFSIEQLKTLALGIAEFTKEQLFGLLDELGLLEEEDDPKKPKKTPTPTPPPVPTADKWAIFESEITVSHSNFANGITAIETYYPSLYTTHHNEKVVDHDPVTGEDIKEYCDNWTIEDAEGDIANLVFTDRNADPNEQVVPLVGSFTNRQHDQLYKLQDDPDNYTYFPNDHKENFDAPTFVTEEGDPDQTGFTVSRWNPNKGTLDDLTLTSYRSNSTITELVQNQSAVARGARKGNGVYSLNFNFQYELTGDLDIYSLWAKTCKGWCGAHQAGEEYHQSVSFIPVLFGAGVTVYVYKGVPKQCASATPTDDDLLSYIDNCDSSHQGIYVSDPTVTFTPAIQMTFMTSATGTVDHEELLSDMGARRGAGKQNANVLGEFQRSFTPCAYAGIGYKYKEDDTHLNIRNQQLSGDVNDTTEKGQNTVMPGGTTLYALILLLMVMKLFGKRLRNLLPVMISLRRGFYLCH